MKTKKLAVLIQADNDKIYQVALTKDQQDWVLSLLIQLHNGTVRCLEQELEGVTLT